MSRLRNHKPKQALDIEGSRHRILRYVMHGHLRRDRIVQIVTWFPGLHHVILQVDMVIVIAVRLIQQCGNLDKVRRLNECYSKI